MVIVSSRWSKVNFFSKCPVFEHVSPQCKGDFYHICWYSHIMPCLNSNMESVRLQHICYQEWPKHHSFQFPWNCYRPSTSPVTHRPSWNWPWWLVRYFQPKSPPWHSYIFCIFKEHTGAIRKWFFLQIQTMVCEKCEKKGKLGKVINPDPWKAGSSNNTTPGAAGGSRKVIFNFPFSKLFKHSVFFPGGGEQAADIKEKSFQSCRLRF